MWLRKGYNKRGHPKEAANVFIPTHPEPCGVAMLSFFAKTDAIKKQIELSAQGVGGQTHPVWSRLVVSHREGLGGCDLLIVRGMTHWEGSRGRLQCVAPMNYEENQWRQEGAQGGWAILSPPDALFLKLWRKEKVEKEKERGKICPAGGFSSKNILVQRLSQTSFRVIWKYISGS